MSIENLALVFGPTIMGYSSHEIDECTFRAESSVQKDVSSFDIHNKIYYRFNDLFENILFAGS